jgi:hypothetical protein
MERLMILVMLLVAAIVWAALVLVPHGQSLFSDAHLQQVYRALLPHF